MHPQDRGEGAESEEEERASSTGEVPSTYGTPRSPTGSTISFNFDLSVYTADDHRSNGRTGDIDSRQEREQGEPGRDE
jgi:hypothetical protein